jgi:hypothetical protein
VNDRARRLVRSGEEFNSDELRDGLVELELPEPSPEPAEDDQVEPWGSGKRHLFRGHRLRAYEEFLRERYTDEEMERDRRGD